MTVVPTVPTSNAATAAWTAMLARPHAGWAGLAPGSWNLCRDTRPSRARELAAQALTGLGEDARRYVTREFTALGSNILIVIPGKVETTGAMPFGGVTHDLTLDDLRAVVKARLLVGRIWNEQDAQFAFHRSPAERVIRAVRDAARWLFKLAAR